MTPDQQKIIDALEHVLECDEHSPVDYECIGETLSIAQKMFGEQKPVCYGIFASDGEMFWDSDHCISDDPDDLDSWLDELQTDQPERGWEILPMIQVKR